MDLNQIAQLMEDYNYHYALSQVSVNPDGTHSVKSLPDLIQAATAQLKLSKLFTGAEAEARVKLAASLLSVIRDEMKKRDIAPIQTNAPISDKKSADAPGEQGEADDWLLESAPDVTFDDIVGLSDVKRDITEALSWPTQHRELLNRIKLEMNNRYLLYGPPGTGKTMIAKAIANYMMRENARFYAVLCSNLVSKYVGDSEKNIKDLFEQAARQERAVIYMDEFEALCPARSEGDNQVNNRIVAELLARTDGINSKTSKTYLIMATNYPWRIDSAMLSRTGNRFYIPLPDEEARAFALKRKLNHLQLDADVDLEALAGDTEGYNHRDINNLCEAMQRSLMRRCISANGALLPLCKIDLDFARATVRSSVNPAEVREMENWVSSTQ